MLSLVKTFFSALSRISRAVQISILVIAVFVTIFQLFFFFMNKDQMRISSNPVQKNRQEIYKVINDPQLQNSEFGRMQIEVHRGFFCTILGEACTENPEDGDNNFQSSFVGKATNAFVFPFANPPASGTMWAFEGMQKAGLAPGVNAQGIGFYALQPISPIWKMFRDISYLIIVLVVVAIGFMIMFRAQVDAQTEISITNALPRIVVTLLLITFSFPIAGFLIDLMYLTMGLGVSLIAQQFPITDLFMEPQALVANQRNLIFGDMNSLYDVVVMNSNLWKTGGAILALVPTQLQVTLRFMLGTAVIAGLYSLNPKVEALTKGRLFGSIPFAGNILGFITGTLLNNIIFGAITGILFPYILSFIVMTTCLLIFFRIFFMLLMTYVKILLSIIFSPIILLFEAFPGKSTFSFWFKGLFFNLATFPVVAILIMVAGLISQVSNYNIGDSIAGADTSSLFRNLWSPPFLYSIEHEGFTMLVSISIIFIIPEIVAWIKKSMGVEDLPFNVTPGTLLAGAGILGGGAWGLTMRARAMTREFGIYSNDGKNNSWSRLIPGIFKTDDPYKNFKPREGADAPGAN